MSYSAPELKTKYKSLQASLDEGARIPLDNSLNTYLGLMPHAEMYLVKGGTLVVTGSNELPGVDVEEYIDGLLQGARPEERELVLTKLEARVNLFKAANPSK